MVCSAFPNGQTSLLYTYIIGQLSIDNQKLQLFEFKDSETSQKFNEYVNYDGIIFKLKEGIILETNVSHVENASTLSNPIVL